MNKLSTTFIGLILTAMLLLLSPDQALATTNPTQNVSCQAISANYHRALTNGDHINATITPPGGQVNMYVDLNIAGGYNTMGLRWKILGVEQTPIPLTQSQVQSGIITFNYAASLSQNSWTVSFVQTNSTDTWPNLYCEKTPPPPSCQAAPNPMPIGANANGVLFTYTSNPTSWSNLSGQTLTITVKGLTTANVNIGLAAYKASGPTWPSSLPQKLVSSMTKTINGCETIELQVTAPNCYYQVDFFTGSLLTGEQLNDGIEYGDRKIKWHNGGNKDCKLKAKKTVLKVVKKSNKQTYKVGQTAIFTIFVKNTGNAVALQTKACDLLDNNWKFVSATKNPTVTGNKICWDIGKLGKGKTNKFIVKAKLIGKVTSTTQVGGMGDHVYVDKREMQIDLEPGEIRTVQLSCMNGYASDGSVRVDHVDQGTGTLDMVIVHETFTVNNHTYQFTVENKATGRAQAKGFVTCLPNASVQTGALLIVKGPLQKTQTLPTGAQTITLTCQAGYQPIGAGYDINSGSARLVKVENVGNNGWQLGFDVTANSDVTMNMRCLKHTLSDGQKLGLKHIVKTIQIAPGMTEHQLTCADDAKGIVATFDIPPSVVVLGHDPRPKTRVFKFYNPTNTVQTGMIDLICINDRTLGKVIYTYKPHAYNTAYAFAKNARKAQTKIKVNVIS